MRIRCIANMFVSHTVLALTQGNQNNPTAEAVMNGQMALARAHEAKRMPHEQIRLAGERYDNGRSDTA